LAWFAEWLRKKSLNGGFSSYRKMPMQMLRLKQEMELKLEFELELRAK